MLKRDTSIKKQTCLNKLNQNTFMEEKHEKFFQQWMGRWVTLQPEFET